MTRTITIWEHGASPEAAEIAEGPDVATLVQHPSESPRRFVARLERWLKSGTQAGTLKEVRYFCAPPERSVHPTRRRRIALPLLRALLHAREVKLIVFTPPRVNLQVELLTLVDRLLLGTTAASSMQLGFASLPS